MQHPDKPQDSPLKSQEDNRLDSPAPYISITGVTHNYPEGNALHEVLTDANLQIGHGEKVALLGRSGSGKTTLLNLIAGIDRADRGSVSVDGIELTALDETARTLFRRRHIGFIYQFFNLVPSLTALENVAFVLELNGIPTREARERSLAIMARRALTTCLGLRSCRQAVFHAGSVRQGPLHCSDRSWR